MSSVSESESSSSDEEQVQVAPIPNKKTGEVESFKPHEDGMLGKGGYNREVPERFTGSGDDTLMRSVVEKYAVELKDKDGKPSGKFYCTPNGAHSISLEVVETHMGLNGGEAINYLNEYFQKAWDHFDVNKDGYIEAERMPTFLRFLI